MCSAWTMGMFCFVNPYQPCRIVTMELLRLLCFVVVLAVAIPSDTEHVDSTSSCRLAEIGDVQVKCHSTVSGSVVHDDYCQDISEPPSFIIKCNDGVWRTVPTELRRTKRGLILAALVGTILYYELTKEPHNTPPVIHWQKPTISAYYAKPRETFAVVTWPAPSVKDKEDGNRIRARQVSGQPSNSKFPRGWHVISYTAKDSKGVADYAQYTFTVTVHVCKGTLPFLDNGYIRCDHNERIAGTICTHHCREGYDLKGNSKRTCQINGKYSGQPPSCAIKTCPNSTELYPANGKSICIPNKSVYRTICTTKCDDGYSLQATGISLMSCQSNGRWSTPLSGCKDSEPPTLLDCPITQYVYTDRGLDTAVVNWNLPTVKDNSGEMISPTQIVGQEPGTEFTIGTVEIRYIATDTAGNKSPPCIFFVHVDQLVCDPPNILDQYLEIDCHGGFSFGSECYLSCRGSYPLIGFDTISCERNTTNPDRVYWDMGTGDVPYCKLNKCPELSPPQNGALTCDKWLFGTQCMMHCHEDYDIPAGTGRFIGQFTCSTSSGIWSPLEAVPGCTEYRNPQFSRLHGEMYYFTGSCNDSATQKRIKENFIAEMQRLQQNGFGGVCANTDDCNVDNVDLQCGPARRRRDIHRLSRQARQASVLVTFNIVVKWERYGNTTSDAFQHLQQKAKSIGDMIGLKVNSGTLNVEGAEVDPTSYSAGRAVIECEPGRYPRYSTLTCASCILGLFYDADQKACIECPRGSYRDIDDLITCTLCPAGTSTATPGTVNATDCVSICEPGYYSLTGVAPCTPCTRFQYGPHEMATQCEECGPGLITSSIASTSQANCSLFDAVMKGEMASKTIGHLQDISDGLTLALWVKLPANHVVTLHVRIGKCIALDIGVDINITLQRSRFLTGVRPMVGSWQHVVVVYHAMSSNISMYLKGDVQFTVQIEMTETTGDVELSSTGDSAGDIRISGLHLTPNTTEPIEIRSLASTCYHNRTDGVNMDTLRNLDSTSVTLTSSICDAEDNCDPDPCNGHVCMDDQDGFICRCDGGFSGNTCQIPPDHCYNHLCDNGATCNNLPTNYTCLCATGFNGMFCEHEIVNGGWSSWSDWSSCSQSCDGGKKTRQRECDDPYPDPEGEPCVGDHEESELCNGLSCPVCPPAPGSYGTILDCEINDGLTTCNASCREGLWFAPGFPPLPEYKCGAETGYEWNGKVPSCTDVYIPTKVGTFSTASYDSDNLCGKEEEIKIKLLVNANDKIDCVVAKKCQVKAVVEGCSGRSKRSPDDSSVNAHIILEVPLQAEHIDISETTQDLNPSVLNFVDSLLSLFNSTQQLNTSKEILKVEVDGQAYAVMDVQSRLTVQCPEGQTPTDALCADCPQGTYNRDGAECISCPYGTYQDETGSMDCKGCPDGLSTLFEESINISDCSVSETIVTTTATTTAVTTEDTTATQDKGHSSTTEASYTGVVIACVIVTICLCAVVVGIAVWQYRRRFALKRQGSFVVAAVEYKPHRNEGCATDDCE